MQQIIRAALQESKRALDDLINNEQTLATVAGAASALITSFKTQGRVFSCGNGGSMSDAMHFAEELSGRFRNNRAALAATAISDAGHLSCVANDYGYEYVFSRYIEAHGRAGDVLWGISTSGKSPNVINAAKLAKEQGMTVIALTGKPDSALGQLADYDICTPGGRYADRAQELHIKVIHIVIELVESGMFADEA